MNIPDGILNHPKVADLLKPPPRELTKPLGQAEQLIRESTSSYPRIWMTVLAQYVAMGFFACILFFIPETPLFAPAGFILFAVLFHLTVLFFKYRYYRKIRSLLVNGTVQAVTVHENVTNWSTEVNDTPQRIIYYEIDGITRKNKLYNHNMADEFEGITLVLFHPGFKLVIPISYLIKYSLRK